MAAADVPVGLIFIPWLIRTDKPTVRLSKPTRGRIRATCMFLAIVALAVIADWGQGRYWWLPVRVKEIIGNLLWAGGTFCLLAMLRPYWSTRTLALLTLALSVAIEASHLLRWAPLEQFRDRGIGYAILGDRFRWLDLIANAAGVVIAAGLDVLIRPEKRRR
ncbi:MAG TPA: DUF2809 domain-containing protein [Tepidisphaeraceae bacterium]|nr:DUF2809 domain-containing protein [Tepidisphaeraceae bacterium]